MKITLSNLGKIKQTQLDLKPLTVIIGPNNSNKTYVAYSIYALWHQAGGGWAHSHTPRRSRFERPTASEWQIKKQDGLTYEIALNKSFYAYFKRVGQIIADSLDTEVLRKFFQDTTGQLFEKTKIEVEVEEEDLRGCLNRLVSAPLVLRLAEFRVVMNCSLVDDVLKIEWKSNPIADDPTAKAGKQNSKPESLLTPADVRTFVSRRLLRYLFFDALAFPAERTALVTTYKPLLLQRFRFYRDARRRTLATSKQQELFEFDEIEPRGEVRFSQPVEDFLDFMGRSDAWPINISAERAEFARLADLVELSIYGGNKVVLHQHGEGANISISAGDVEMDLWNASSSIKQLVPLMLYLRYLAEKGDFLIIDEPEMNLHPIGQAQLLEVLTALVNAGVRILITTHSSYIMTHLNTLISGKIGHSRTLKKQSKNLYLQEPSSFLKPEDVSAYEMRDNKLVSLYDEDYGIRWDTLSDVSAELRDKYLDIME